MKDKKTKVVKAKSKKGKKKLSKKTTKKSADSVDDPAIIVIDDNLEVDQEKEMEERKAYLEEARSQDSGDWLNIYPFYWVIENMRALCLITIKPGTIDKVITLLVKKRKIAKEILPVTGRADVCVLLNGSIDDINTTVMDFKKINYIVSTETLIEMEVDLGW